jgi:hypothetical protein
MVVDEVFCRESTDSELVQMVLDGLPELTVACDVEAAGATPGGLAALTVLEQTRRLDDGSFRQLPERLATVLDATSAGLLTGVRAVLLAATVAPASAQDEPFDIDALVTSIETVLEGRLVMEVFSGAGFSTTFWARRRALFDALYKLYILRRRIAVDLQEITDGLETLHALEWLAIDRFLVSAADRLDSLNADERALLTWLEGWLPELRPHGLVAARPPRLVDSSEALLRLLEAMPVVHPIFAQLHRFRQPFNPIRPLGIGDLKVVKQWLVEYAPGEISHIANVLKGEVNERTTRRLDRTEDQFSFTSQSNQETSTDTQTTDHLEVKREVESMVKTELQLKVDASVSVKPNAMLQIGASAGFAFSRSAQDSSKVAQQFAHDMVSKAVSRVQTQANQTRALTKTFESEENVKHTVTNDKQGRLSGSSWNFVGDPDGLKVRR